MRGVDVVDVLVLALAVWRLASLLTYERGPFNLFERLRSVVNIRHNAHGRPEVWPESFWGELLTCVWCISPYIGALAVVLYFHYGILVVWLALPFALSALAIMINKQVK